MKINSVIFMLVISNLCFSEIVTEIFLNKYEFLEAEPIIFTIKFKNNSSTVDSINYFALVEYDGSIKIRGGIENIHYNGYTADFLFGVPYIKMHPYQEIIKVCNILDHYGNTEIKYNYYSRELYLNEGTYTIKYEFRDNEKNSNELTLVVNKPRNKDLEAFQKLIRAYQINDGMPWIINNVLGIWDSIYLKRDIFCDVATNYLESNYNELAIYRYNKEIGLIGIDSLIIDIDKYFVEKFPESYFMTTVLTTLCKALYKFTGGEDAVIDYLTYIIQNFSNFGVSNIAKVCLQTKNYLK